MSTISLADMANTFALRRQSGAIKAQQQQLANEMTSGVVADTGAHLRGNFTELGAIDASLSRLNAYKGANAAAAGTASAMQAALDQVGKVVDRIALVMADPSMIGSGAGVDAAAAEANEGFQSAVALLNTDFGGQKLFAGTGTENALADADVILAALEDATAGAQSASELAAAVKGWFDSPEGYAAVAYGGDAARAPLAVGPGEQVALGITAMDPALRDTLQSLAIGALVHRGALADDPAGRQGLIQGAGNALVASKDARTALQTTLGTAEGHIERARVRSESESAALKMARVGLVVADPYETAVRFEATSTQLETLHAVTARLSKLSLVDFI